MTLLAVVTAIVGGLFFLYRVLNAIEMGKDAVDKGVDLARDSKAMVRRAKWNRKKNYDPRDQLTDPREVATVLMIETAKCGGEITTTQKQIISEIMQREFDFSDSEAAEMMASVTYLTREMPDVENILVRLLKPIHHMSEQDKRDLIKMMSDVASTDGEADPYQERFISVVKGKLFSQNAPKY